MHHELLTQVKRCGLELLEPFKGVQSGKLKWVLRGQPAVVEAPVPLAHSLLGLLECFRGR